MRYPLDEWRGGPSCQPAGPAPKGPPHNRHRVQRAAVEDVSGSRQPNERRAALHAPSPTLAPSLSPALTPNPGEHREPPVGRPFTGVAVQSTVRPAILREKMKYALPLSGCCLRYLPCRDGSESVRGKAGRLSPILREAHQRRQDDGPRLGQLSDEGKAHGAAR